MARFWISLIRRSRLIVACCLSSNLLVSVSANGVPKATLHFANVELNVVAEVKDDHETPIKD